MTDVDGQSAARRHFDPGLQPERTELAWRRTILALAAGSLISERLLAPLIGLWALAVALAGLALAVTCWVVSAARARRTKRVLLGSPGPPPGAGLLLVLAVAVTVGAVTGLAYVLSRHLMGA